MSFCIDRKHFPRAPADVDPRDNGSPSTMSYCFCGTAGPARSAAQSRCRSSAGAPLRKPVVGVQAQSPKVWVGRCFQDFPSLHLPVFAHFKDPYTCKSVNSPVLRLIGNIFINVHFSTSKCVLLNSGFKSSCFFLD